MMFNTKFYKNRWRPLNFRQIWFFFIVTSNYKNSMYPRSFLCDGAKIKQRYSLKKRTLWNRWGSNMGISIHILFFIKKKIKSLIHMLSCKFSSYQPSVSICHADLHLTIHLRPQSVIFTDQWRDIRIATRSPPPPSPLPSLAMLI